MNHVPAHRALEHPNRQLILATVTATPGLSMRALVRCTGIPSGTLVHHLRVLARSGLLRIERGPHAAHAHYPASIGRPARQRAWLTRHGLRDVYAAVHARAGARQKDILDAFPDQPRSTTQHRLRRLQAAGLVHADRAGRSLHYHAAGQTSQNGGAFSCP